MEGRGRADNGVGEASDNPEKAYILLLCEPSDLSVLFHHIKLLNYNGKTQIR